MRKSAGHASRTVIENHAPLPLGYSKAFDQRLARVGMPGRPEPEALILAIMMAALFMILARIFDKGKGVWIDDGTLIVSDYRRETRIDLSEAKSVKVTRSRK